MSILTPALQQEDDVFRAFALGEPHRGETTRSIDLGSGNTALVSHGVTIALRSEEIVMFDALPHAEYCRAIGRIVAHSGRAAVFAEEHYGDDECVWYDHGAFVELATRLATGR